MAGGWIKIHRKVQEHWLWQNPVEFQWWMDILLEANYERKECRIKNTVYIVERGDILYSLKTWSIRWGSNVPKVRRFLKMLEKANMIRYKSETQTTRVTVLKYDDYQLDEKKSETHLKRKRNGSETEVKSTKQIKEIKKFIPPTQTEFMVYAKSKMDEVIYKNNGRQQLLHTFDAWSENDWKDGYDKPIKNWRSKINHSLKFIK